MQALFRRAQLKALVDIHSTEFQSEGLGGGYLLNEEINIIRGALDMTEKKAFVGMTPLDKVLHCTACKAYASGSMSLSCWGTHTLYLQAAAGLLSQRL